MEIKRFDDLNNFTREEEELLKDLIQDLDDEWDLNDMTPISSNRSHKNINYLFMKMDISGQFTNPILTDAYHMLVTNAYNMLVTNGVFIAFYFDLTGPNDFYTIRLKFLEDLERISNRIQALDMNSKILKDRHHTSKFILYITK